jgi:hypothetical protein
MTNARSIVVMTPVKNDDWILERFLAVTSTFADHIIIADQGSIDKSRAICADYPKVTLIENPSDEYDEASRQSLLIDKARAVVPGGRILLALDADEILAADARDKPGWNAMMAAAPGTVLLFEKPDLLSGLERCIRYDRPFPLGYVDDGAEHKAKKIHSPRVPMPEDASRLAISDVKVLHYALTRATGQAAKHRRYSVLEHLMQKGTFIGRRFAYASNRDYTQGHRVEECPNAWFERWEMQGIDMRSIKESRYYWQDFDVLRTFERYGTRKFWLENIWDQDWEACRLVAASGGVQGIPTERIEKPPRLMTSILKLVDRIYAVSLRLRRLWHRMRTRAGSRSDTRVLDMVVQQGNAK